MFNSKKIKVLKEENEELKTKFQAIYIKEDNIKNLTELIKKLRFVVAQLHERRKMLLESINKFRLEEGNKKLEIEELNKRIGHLREMKDELQNVILSYSNQIDNIDITLRGNAERQTTQGEYENELISKKEEIEQSVNNARLITNNIVEEEAELVETKETLSNEVDQLEEKLKELTESYSELEASVNNGNERIQALKVEEEKLKSELENKRNEIANMELNLLRLKEEEKILLGKIGGLNENENLLSGRIDILRSAETSMKSKVKEIDSELSEKTELKSSLEQEHLLLMNDLNAKRDLLTQIQADYEKLFEDTRIRTKELFDTEQSLSIKAQKLSNVNIELMDYDQKVSSLKENITELEKVRNGLIQNIQNNKEASEDFVDKNRKLSELVPLLEKRKQEIEQGNVEMEVRFTTMFQKFNHELNQINRKRSVLEEIVLKKEKDVDEKDQLLFEKIASLEESERILNMRQIEIESLEKQIAGLSEHKNVFRNDLNKMEQEAVERQNYTADIRLETDLLLKKKVTLEKNLHELLTFMNDNYERAKGRNSKFENELSYYEDKIQEYRTRISDSLKELDDIKAAVGTLKIEREEYKSNINKLSSLKKKLHEEITKHQSILQRYQKMREKLKLDQTTGRSFEDIPAKGKSIQPKELINSQIYK